MWRWRSRRGYSSSSSAAILSDHRVDHWSQASGSLCLPSDWQNARLTCFVRTFDRRAAEMKTSDWPRRFPMWINRLIRHPGRIGVSVSFISCVLLVFFGTISQATLSLALLIACLVGSRLKDITRVSTFWLSADLREVRAAVDETMASISLLRRVVENLARFNFSSIAAGKYMNENVGAESRMLAVRKMLETSEALGLSRGDIKDLTEDYVRSIGHDIVYIFRFTMSIYANNTKKGQFDRITFH